MNPFSRAYRFYIESFRGLRKEVWLLSLITFVNRAGTMVIPFLTIYLTKDMGLSLEEVGWIMSCFGAGSVMGSWIGGKLTDKLGFYSVIAGSLISSGIFFFVLQTLDGFKPFCVGVFILTFLADGFRPALFVALRSYCDAENRTRAVTLVRLAINLGFSMGPAIGGLIIVTLGYSGLFWIDGVTCISAALLFMFMLPYKDPLIEEEKKQNVAIVSPYRDRPYLLFVLITILISVPFIQYFSAVPLFYKDVHFLDEASIGLIMGFNGLLIFLTEMPLIKYCEKKNFQLYHILSFSVFLIALSFIVLNIWSSILVLWFGMFLMTVGEMLNFPFMNRFAFDRSEKGRPGAYMGLFTIAWSIAHIIGHNLGLNLIKDYGFSWTWNFMTVILFLAISLIFVLRFMVKKEEKLGGT